MKRFQYIWFKKQVEFAVINRSKKHSFFSHRSGASPNQFVSEHAFPRAFTATALACELATTGRKGREGSGRGWNTLRAASPSISLERSKETARRVRLEGLKKELAARLRLSPRSW